MAAACEIVTLTTDFGTSDTFVGEMKGVILGIAPRVAVVDLTHEVPAHDVAAGAFLLASGCRAFPPGTVHLAVVDPGVGTRRRAVAVETDDAFFVGPDNGLLARALRDRRVVRTHALDRLELARPTLARTFEGRDRFAPAAARIASGTPLESLGPRVADLARAAAAAPPGASGDDVTVVHVDRFGNVFLDLDRETVAETLARGAEIVVELPDGTLLDRVVGTYADVESDRAAVLFNASDVLEIAVRDGSAADRWGLRRGDAVRVALRPSRPRAGG